MYCAADRWCSVSRSPQNNFISPDEDIPDVSGVCFAWSHGVVLCRKHTQACYQQPASSTCMTRSPLLRLRSSCVRLWQEEVNEITRKSGRLPHCSPTIERGLIVFSATSPGNRHTSGGDAGGFHQVRESVVCKVCVHREPVATLQMI